MEFIFGLVRWILIIVLLGVILFRIFRIIRPFETGLVERLGKFNREASPGLISFCQDSRELLLLI